MWDFNVWSVTCLELLDQQYEMRAYHEGSPQKWMLKSNAQKRLRWFSKSVRNLS